MRARLRVRERGRFLRLFVCVLLVLLSSRPCRAWDTLPHQRITKAALDSLSKPFLATLGVEVQALIDIYCIFPDRYEEMEHYGFVRKSPGPRTVAEIKAYCVRPDGQPVHGASGDRKEDTASLVYLIERLIAGLTDRRPGEAAKYAGVLSHFVGDSLSPPHAVDADQLLAMTPLSARGGRSNMHSAIERSIPEFGLEGRAPRLLGGGVAAVAKAILDACYDGAERNRRDLPSMVKAVADHDEAALDAYRLRAGRRATEILADALFSVERIAGGGL